MVNGPMGGNMGTPPAPSQPPQVNFTTTAESRGGFNNFLKSIPQTTNMTPLPPMGSPQMPPMGGNPMANIDIFNQPMGMMGMNQPQMNPMMQQPMQQQPMNMGMMQQPMMMANGGNVDKNDIGVDNFADKNGGIVDGLPRMWKSSPDQPMTYLSYITGEEQNFLRQSNIHEKDDPNRIGQPGPKGVPSFDDPGGDTEDQGSDFSGGDDSSNNNDSYSDNDFGGFSGYSPVDQTDFSSPDDDMDYTDPDYGYTTVDPNTGKSDMDISSNIGFNQNIANIAAQAQADAKAKADLAAKNQAALNQQIKNASFVSQAKKGQLARANLMSAINPPVMGNMIAPNVNQVTVRGDQPRGTDVDRDAAVQAASIQGQGKSGNDGSGIDFGINLGLGPDVTPTVAAIGPTSGPNTNADITGFGSSRDKSDFSLDIDALSGKEEDAKKGTFFRDPQNPITAAINALSKIGPQATISNIAKGYAPTYDQKTGQITGTSNYGIGMGMPSSDNKAGEGFGMGQGPLGNIFGTGKTVPGYDVFDATSPSIGMYNTPTDTSDDGGDPLILRRPIAKPIEEEDDGDKPPNVIGGGDPITPPASGPVVVDSPFTSNVGDYTPVGFSAGDLNKLIAQLTGVAAPQSMAQGGVAGYAGGGLISAVDNFLASV